jgi:hypothetical protein
MQKVVSISVLPLGGSFKFKGGYEFTDYPELNTLLTNGYKIVDKILSIPSPENAVSFTITFILEKP